MSIDTALKGQPIFFQQPWLKRLTIAGVAGVAAHWLVTGWLLRGLSDLSSVPLHYTIYFGIDWLGDWHWLFLWPIGVTLILLGNSILAKKILSRSPLLSYVLMVGAVLVIFVGLAASVSVAYINF